MAQETFEFQAQARQLLNLVVNSIYSNKEIFLRELLSNASDALDKLRLEVLQHSELEADTSDLHITLERDAQARTLKVIDNGIGMNRQDLQDLIGTIARSGTAEFLQQATENKSQAQALIGQFGVGFYSVFMVAQRVVIETRKLGEKEAYRWESAGDGSYTIEEIPEHAQGTTITLYLKEADEENELADYTQEWVLRDLVKRYSDFISYPIRMLVTKRETEPAAEEGQESKTVERQELETLNSMKALWARPESEVDPQEYKDFYKRIAYDWQDPMQTITLKGEGTFEFQALLFIPAKAPYDLYMPEQKRGVQLYVKRVFIMDDCQELVPSYLRFLRGVVDSSDLSLNVSREILQKDRQIRAINKSIVRKVLGVLKSLLKDKPEEYREFWAEYGKVLKEGLYNDSTQRERLLDLLLVASTKGAELTTLEDYVARMVEGQEDIYYITGENRSVLEKAPQMEAFRAKGVEVLLLSDPIDSLWVEMVPEFKGKKLKSILRSGLELGSESEKKAAEEKLDQESKDLASTLAWLGSALKEEVKEVKVTNRLTDSPACLVSSEHDPSPSMEKIMKAMGQAFPPVKRILEINPEHPLIKRLHQLQSQEGEKGELEDIARLLYDQALLAEGGELPDPSSFAARLSKVLGKALG